MKITITTSEKNAMNMLAKDATTIINEITENDTPVEEINFSDIKRKAYTMKTDSKGITTIDINEELFIDVMVAAATIYKKFMPAIMMGKSLVKMFETQLKEIYESLKILDKKYEDEYEDAVLPLDSPILNYGFAVIKRIKGNDTWESGFHMRYSFIDDVDATLPISQQSTMIRAMVDDEMENVEDGSIEINTIFNTLEDAQEFVEVEIRKTHVVTEL